MKHNIFLIFILVLISFQNSIARKKHLKHLVVPPAVQEAYLNDKCPKIALSLKHKHNNKHHEHHHKFTGDMNHLATLVCTKIQNHLTIKK